MKKVLIVFFLLFSFITVKAEVNDSEVKINWISGVYYRYWYNGELHWGQMGYIYTNGVISYCIDIDKTISTNIYSSTNTISVNENIPLYAYFGYGYLHNNSLEYYLATQKLIWESLGIKIKYTTASEGNGNWIDVSEYQNNILSYINEFNKNPDLDSNFNFNIGDTNLINDKNNTINNYYVVNDTINGFGIYNNNLLINSNLIGSNSFLLKTNYFSRGENKMYYSNNSQSLIQIGNILNKEYKYDYNIIGGTLNINLYDNLTLSNVNSGLSTFKGNIFKLYDSNDNIIGTYETDEEGMVYIENLDVGMYRLEHSNVSEGYIKDKENYEFEIISGDINKNIDIYLKPKEINFKIKKTYSNPKLNNINYDDGILFEIYNSKNELVDELLTDKNGEANINLIYDSYTIIQKNVNNELSMSDSYFIDNTNFNSDIVYDIYNPVLTSKLKLYLYESNSSIPIPNARIIIDQKEYVTNEEGFIITDYLEEGNYIIEEEDIEGYLKNENISFDIKEDSDFYLYDNMSFINLNIYNDKIPVEIIEESPVIINPEKEVENENKDIENEIKVLPNLNTYFFNIYNKLYAI